MVGVSLLYLSGCTTAETTEQVQYEASHNKHLGSILSIRPDGKEAVVVLLPEADWPVGTVLVARDNSLQPTGTLAPIDIRRDNTAAAKVLQGKPRVHDNVVLPSPQLSEQANQSFKAEGP